MGKKIKRVLQVIFILVAIFLLYIAANLIYSTIYDYQPDEKIVLKTSVASTNTIVNKDTLSIISWNVGYGGIGQESYMFYDLKRTFTSGGYEVTTDKAYVRKNVDGMKRFIQQHASDFYVFQEVDTASSRSYNINEFREMGDVIPSYSHTFATNYSVDRVPIPLLQPWNVLGKVRAGLSTYGRYQPAESTRYQLPGDFEWPTRIYHLDRCLLVQRYKTDNGKDLIMINLHNSAYDQGGFMKKTQLEYLKNLIEKEYKAGHYIVVGGDWNMSPPESDLVHLYDDGTPGIEFLQEVENFMEDDWKWIYDDRFTTSRKAGALYKRLETPEKLIDFFLISPNVASLEVETLKQAFEFSDHEAVRMKFVLR